MLRTIFLFIVSLSIIGFSSCNKAKPKPATEIENKKFFVGDVNNDKINDTAFVSQNKYIEFNKNIAKLSFEESFGIYVEKIEDFNNDKANEIIIFSRTHEGWWNDVYVYSFQNGKWIELAKTKAFLSENKDFKNRIVYENGFNYLIGDNMWEENEDGSFKQIKVKI